MSFSHSRYEFEPIAARSPGTIVRASRSFRKFMRDTPAARGMSLLMCATLVFVGYVALARLTASSSIGMRFVDLASNAERNITLNGPWQHVLRANGNAVASSIRSFRAGSSADFRFTGSRVAILGVLGDKGGNARVLIDDRPAAVISFYARRREAGRIVYSSPVLKQAMHRLQVIVLAPSDREPHRRYTNIDGVKYFPG